MKTRPRSALRHALIICCALLCTTTAHADLAALDWLQGRWQGPFGQDTLEETWTTPASGTVAALVRMMHGDATRIVELIAVSEQDGRPVLRIQQFNADLEPLFSPAQTLTMTSMNERSVTFEAENTGGLRRLTYAQPQADRLDITVTLTEGTEFTVHLTRI